ncbi:unnamed protein product [Rhizophagus irregularis]|nr:unnamed protein product [Rhizophagus irregularis]CAB5368146.1 unnamed protein product [Rhizophagus irregularis]
MIIKIVRLILHVQVYYHNPGLRHNISEGQDIEEAIKGIKGTVVANINPDQKQKGKKPVMAGISNWFEFQWPVNGEFSGFVRGHALSNFGKWNDFSPSAISKSMKGDK